MPKLFCLWRVLFVVLLLLFSIGANAQIEGVVLDTSDRSPVVAATVKAVRDGKTIDFATTNDKGVFVLRRAKAPVCLTFRHLAYASKSVDITTDERVEYLLTPETTQLKDVTVHATRVEMRGDTTSYLVNQYASNKDVTVGDALKKMPGIQVSEGGTVSYLGKTIDKLKIDGKELLGKDYDIAIRNLRHNSVAKVEIMERQQEVKALQGLVADDKLIMNLVLNRNSRGRLNGNVEAGIGGEKGGVNYQGGINLLHFLGKMQTVAAGHYQNNADAYVEENRRTFEDPSNTSAVAPLLSSGWGASVPEVSDTYFRHKRGGRASVHSAFDTGRDRSFRVNASMEDFKYSHSYGNDITYLTPGMPDIQLSESDVTAETQDGEGRVSLTFNNNAGKHFLNNKLTYIGHKTSRVETFVHPDKTWMQTTDHTSHVVNNQWGSYIRFGRKAVNLSSTLAAEFYPKMNLYLEDFSQHVDERILRGAVSAFYLHPLGGDWNLGLPLSYDISNDHVQMERQITLRGLTQGASFSPNLNYVRGQNNFTLSVPVSYRSYDFRSSGHEGYKKGYWNVEPNLSLRYTFTPAWSLYASAKLYQTQGDITDFITDPVRLNYRTAYSGIGILKETKGQSFLTNVFYRKPLRELYSNLMVFFRHQSMNLNSQDFPAEQVNLLSRILQTNDHYNLQVNGSVSKNFRRYYTKVTANISYSHSQSTMVRQGLSSRMSAQSLMGSLGVNMEPADFLELSYDVNIGTSKIKYGDTNMRGLMTLHQEVSLDLVPSLEWSIGVNAEHLMKEIKTDDYSHLFLMGLSGQYKSGSHVVKMTVSNLFNQQEYRFALYDGATMYNSWYRLRGLSGLMSYRYYF